MTLARRAGRSARRPRNGVTALGLLLASALATGGALPALAESGAEQPEVVEDAAQIAPDLQADEGAEREDAGSGEVAEPEQTGVAEEAAGADEAAAETEKDVKGLVLLVEFKDKKFTVPQSTMNDMMNSHGSIVDAFTS